MPRSKLWRHLVKQVINTCGQSMATIKPVTGIHVNPIKGSKFACNWCKLTIDIPRMYPPHLSLSNNTRHSMSNCPSASAVKYRLSISADSSLPFLQHGGYLQMLDIVFSASETLESVGGNHRMTQYSTCNLDLHRDPPRSFIGTIDCATTYTEHVGIILTGRLLHDVTKIS